MTEDKMEELCLIMCLVGVAATFAATLQGACFKIFSELQAFKWLDTSSIRCISMH